MVFTLHRYIFRELMKIFVLAAVGLTLMLSLGSVLRFVQEFGVGPRQVMHLMGYSLPITLTFVLPIAALFAGAQVYGRLTSDNELDACRASGVGLLTLVYPGAALAIMVAIANLVLSFHVMPAFVQRAEKSLKADAQKIIFRNIQRKGYYKHKDGRNLIYADYADLQKGTLSGVVITELKGNRIGKIIATETASVKFNPHSKFNQVQITAHNTYQMDPEDVWSLGLASFIYEFPPLMGDDIKFKKLSDMKKIAHNPILFSPIEKLARQAYAQFTSELLAQDITAQIADGATSFYQLYSGQKLIEFTAGKCTVQGEKKIELSGEVVVIESDVDTKKRLRVLQCSRASLEIEDEQSEPTLTMVLYTPAWQHADGDQGFARGVVFRGLIIDKFAAEDILAALEPDSIASALQGAQSPQLMSLQKELSRQIAKTRVEVDAEMHSRLVFGIGCVSMILIGIGLGILKRGGHLLSAFGASCIPAAILIVCIMMGKNITKNPDAQVGSGILLMWSGLIVLSVLAVLLYRKLLKN